jgi:hypothetical protein
MRRQIFFAAFAGLSLATLSVSSAAAGGWGANCGCGYYPGGQIYYAPPTYSYAEPTITVVPHYVVQPNYVVRRTYVVRQTRYVNEPPRYINEPKPCPILCGLDHLFDSGPAVVAPTVSYESYAPTRYPRHYRGYYHPNRRYYHSRRHRYGYSRHYRWR